MTDDPRIEAITKFGISPRLAAVALVQADAADLAAGIVRVDTRDEATVGLILKAVRDPFRFAGDRVHIKTYPSGRSVKENLHEWQARAVLTALRGETQP